MIRSAFFVFALFSVASAFGVGPFGMHSVAAAASAPAVGAGISATSPATALSKKQDCATLDLRKDPRMPPARSQTGNAWCFAYAMATVTGFSVKEEVSALSFIMAPAWTKGLKGTERFSQGLNEADMPQIFNEAQNWGFCRERDLPSDFQQYDGRNLSTVYNRIGNANLEPKCSFSAAESTTQDYDTSMAFPMANLYDIVQSSAGSSKDAALFQLGKKSCEQNKFTPENKLHFTWESSRANPLSDLNSLLNENKPVGVNFYAQPVLKTKLNFQHASTIIGRRWNKGTCEYLIRDPYGEDTLSTRAHASENHGDIYVPEADLLKGSPRLWTIR